VHDPEVTLNAFLGLGSVEKEFGPYAELIGYRRRARGWSAAGALRT
jgi:hypothetical protein